jgi:Tol biopolymer transport system component
MERATSPSLARFVGPWVVLLVVIGLLGTTLDHDRDASVRADAPVTSTTPPTTTALATTTTVAPATTTTAVATTSAPPTTRVRTTGTTAPPTTAPRSSGPPRSAHSFKGSIVYISDAGSPPKVPTTGPVTPGPGGYNIWIMDGDGRNQRPLTTSSADAQPSLSPDGRTVAWVKYSHQVWLMGADGSSPRQIAECPVNCQEPRWSADGGRLLYVESSDDAGDIIVLRPDGTVLQRVQNGTDHYDADWSPDGSRLVSSGYGDDHGLYVIDLATGTERKIVSEYIGSPTFSPDGSLILFNSDGSHLAVVRPDGSNPRQVSTGTGQFLAGRYSPDGATIVFDYFAGVSGRKEQVGLMAADGTNVRLLTDGTTEAYESSW